MTQKELLSKIPRMEQRQDSITKQVRDLICVATRLGMYDIANWLEDNFPFYKNQDE